MKDLFLFYVNHTGRQNFGICPIRNKLQSGLLFCFLSLIFLLIYSQTMM